MVSPRPSSPVGPFRSSNRALFAVRLLQLPAEWSAPVRHGRERRPGGRVPAPAVRGRRRPPPGPAAGQPPQTAPRRRLRRTAAAAAAAVQRRRGRLLQLPHVRADGGARRVRGWESRPGQREPLR